MHKEVAQRAALGGGGVLQAVGATRWATGTTSTMPEAGLGQECGKKPACKNCTSSATTEYSISGCSPACELCCPTQSLEVRLSQQQQLRPCWHAARSLDPLCRLHIDAARRQRARWARPAHIVSRQLALCHLGLPIPASVPLNVGYLQDHAHWRSLPTWPPAAPNRTPLWRHLRPSSAGAAPGSTACQI